MQNGKQNRIPMEPKFDGRGIPSEAHYQLGCDTMGKTTVRAVGDTMRTGGFRPMRITSSHIHRIQGKYCLYSIYFNNIVVINGSYELCTIEYANSRIKSLIIFFFLMVINTFIYFFGF